VVALVFFGVASLFFFDESILTSISQSVSNKTNKLRASGGDNSRKPTNESSCLEFRKYPYPQHHSGLPYLGDVFASYDRQLVYFIGINRGDCLEEWSNADTFAATSNEQHRFMCVFNEDTHVISEVVHESSPFSQGFIIRCKIPQQFQHFISQGQETTLLHVDLHATDDLEMNRTGPLEVRQYPSVAIADTPALKGLPICHPVSERNVRPNQFNLTAFTRIKSNYALSHYLPSTNATMTSPLSRLLEWIDYHQQQGFDHFIIYDNDEEPHGQIEDILKRHIESGLVTYRWFPLEDCWVDFGDWKDYLFAAGQMVASLAALHRMSFATKFYAHMDVDEFFIPLQTGKSVLDIVMESDPTVDAFKWVPILMAPCNGTQVNASESVLSKWRCLTDQHYADVKLIMRASRMFYFFVHYPILTVDGTYPKEYVLDETAEGFLAHYRSDPGDEDNARAWKDTYSGLVQNEFTNEAHFMDAFLKTQQEKMKPST